MRRGPADRAGAPRGAPLQANVLGVPRRHRAGVRGGPSAFADPRRFLAAVEHVYPRVAILEGRSGTTMSAWSSFRSGPLSLDDASALVAYLRTWSDRPPVALDNRPPWTATRCGAPTSSRATAPRATESAGWTGRSSASGASTCCGRRATASCGRPSGTVSRGRPCPRSRAAGRQGVDDVLAVLRSWQRNAPPGESRRRSCRRCRSGQCQSTRTARAGRSRDAAVNEDRDAWRLRPRARMLLDARAPSDLIASTSPAR